MSGNCWEQVQIGWLSDAIRVSRPETPATPNGIRLQPLICLSSDSAIITAD